MDGPRFDALVAALGRTTERRPLLLRFVGAALLATLGRSAVGAQKKAKGKKGKNKGKGCRGCGPCERCSRGNRCVPDDTKDGTTCSANGASGTCCGGACVACGQNQTLDPVSCACTGGGCQTAADCEDNSPCTTNTCNPSNRCEFLPIANCCTSNAHCDDGNPCTTNTCNASNRCEFPPIADCCRTAADCEDGFAITTNRCVHSACVTEFPPCAGPGSMLCQVAPDLSPDPEVGVFDCCGPTSCEGNLGRLCVPESRNGAPAGCCAETETCNPQSGVCEGPPTACDTTTIDCAAATEGLYHCCLDPDSAAGVFCYPEETACPDACPATDCPCTTNEDCHPDEFGDPTICCRCDDYYGDPAFGHCQYAVVCEC